MLLRINVIVISLIFVNWAQSNKIYEINVDDEHTNNINTLHLNEILRIIISKLESNRYEVECNALCKSNTTGIESTLNLNCKVKSNYTNAYNSSQYVYAEADIDNSSKSFYGEWSCEFVLKQPNNKSSFINLDVTFDTKEHWVITYQSTEGNLIWKIIGIFAISISISEAIYIICICFKSNGSDKSDYSMVSENVEETSRISISPPPPPLSPKFKRFGEFDTLPCSSLDKIQNEPTSINTDPTITETPIYEVMVSRQRKLSHPVAGNKYESTMSEKRLSYQDLLHSDHIYDNDIVLLQNGRTRPPFETYRTC